MRKRLSPAYKTLKSVLKNNAPRECFPTPSVLRRLVIYKFELNRAVY